MSNEKIIYLAMWKDQEKYPDFEPLLIEVLDKLETTKRQLAVIYEYLGAHDILIEKLGFDLEFLNKLKDERGE